MPESIRRNDSELAFVPEDGEVARLIRAYDWSRTPLGPPSQWSASLRMVVRFMLANRFPHLLWWGPDHIQIYNDHYIPILGSKHPDQALGKPVRECWHEIYEVLAPLIDTPFNGGPATWIEDLELIVRRHGFPEESHFIVAYSPVPDDTAPRGIGGVLATVHETTEKVLAERRASILGELGARVIDTKTEEEACVQAVDILSRHPKDIPFALLYLVDEARRELRLVSATGVPADSIGPEVLGLDTPLAESRWPLAKALATETVQMHAGLASLLPVVPMGPWPDCPDTAVVVPIKSNIAGRPAGALVVGISAYIRLDARYLSFVELAASQLATAVANARAYEEERRRAEALAEIDRAKTVFFSNVSHEFRTPLTLMLGPLEHTLSDMSMPAPLRSQIEVARRNAQRLLKLVNSLLDFARIEAGRIQASFAPVDLSVLTTDLSSTFRSAMQLAKLEFDVECEPLGEPVYIDREMWEKVVLNLLSNAFKFTLQGRVSVRLTRGGPQAVLEVSDTGVGVPQEALPLLFDRFYRVEGTEARTHEGSGIGLALVQELVKLHGGSIEVASELGVGTTFRVGLPFGVAHLPPERIRAAPSLESTAIDAEVYLQEALRWLPDEPDSRGGTSRLMALTEPQAAQRDHRFAATFGARILLVDDNADMRSYVRQLLSPHYAVEAVADGVQALQAARRLRPDLILADVMMPRMNGFELLAALRADDDLADVPFIMLSARAGEEARIEGFRAGADDYIVKPFHARELLARAGAILELTKVRRENEQQYRAYVQATSDVVYRMSADWTEMKYLAGRSFLPDQAAPNRNWLQKYIVAADQPAILAAATEAIREKRVLELEHRVIRADGSLGWTSSRAIPLLDCEGEIVEWFGAATDITRRRETREALERQRRQLEDADRQKNEFLAMLAHELRNPLAPIRNAGELLTRTSLSDPQARSALATVERQVKHLTRLVDDLLDISRITQNRIELRRSPVRLEQVITHALEAIDPLIRQKQHRVALVQSRQPLTVNGDPERLVQCFGNVIANAAKYTPAAGEIDIESREEGGAAIVTIRDNGVGIPEELLPNVFDLFVQGERTLDRAQGGLGIGLTIVKRLIDMHGGTIGVSSKGTGRGASFEIRLPLVQIAESVTIVPKMQARASRRILLVDDNADGVYMLAELLRFDGHEVETALSGVEALERIPAFQPDVALVDIGLPGLDGYEVARRIREQPDNDHIQLIAITGYGRDEDRDRTHRAGFSAHLVKPVEFSALQRALT